VRQPLPFRAAKFNALQPKIAPKIAPCGFRRDRRIELTGCHRNLRQGSLSTDRGFRYSLMGLRFNPLIKALIPAGD
jgi:hypothetical protein